MRPSQVTPRQETKRVLEELRRRIKQSPMSQRQIEAKAGFSKGYLSQLLAQNLDLKFWHILGILGALGISPGEFFGQVYPPPTPTKSALDDFRSSSAPLPQSMDRLLEDLYELGFESLAELRDRVDRCEDVIQHLEDLGILEPPKKSSGG